MSLRDIHAQDQNLQDQLVSNAHGLMRLPWGLGWISDQFEVILCRNPGDVDDRQELSGHALSVLVLRAWPVFARWDRYCAVRRVGKATYVKATKHAYNSCSESLGLRTWGL